MHSQELGDYLGVESCTDFIPDVAAISTSNGGAGTIRHRRIRRIDAVATTEFPPPIPRAEDLVMKKYRTSDGRLVITEERAPRHQYFQVRRSDGRLRLNLIPADDAVVEEGRREGGGGGEEKFGFPGNVEDSGQEIGGGHKRIGAPLLEEVFIGVETCGGFGVAMAGLRSPVPI